MYSYSNLILSLFELRVVFVADVFVVEVFVIEVFVVEVFVVVVFVVVESSSSAMEE